MALPNNRLSTTAEDSGLLSPDSLAASATYDYEQGGVGLNDPSEGLQVQTWAGYASGDNIIFEDEGGATTVVTTVPGGVRALSISFDQNMRPHVAYVDSAGLANLYWYDTILAMPVTTPFPGITNPRLAHDDKRRMESGSSDIILAYVRDAGLYYRQQRDRFDTERVLDPAIGALRLRNVAMGTNHRLHFILS